MGTNGTTLEETDENRFFKEGVLPIACGSPTTIWIL
jgi:hypothetical protein